MGTQRAEVALHFGPGQGRFIKQHINCKEGKGWNSDFHEYELEWTPGKCHITKQQFVLTH
jgi:hypothetical protein